MNYFSFRPNTYGWATSNVMAMMPFDMHLPEDRSFLGYKSKRHIEELENFVKEFDDNLSKRKNDPRKSLRDSVRRYHEELSKVEPAEVVILTTTDTISSKPPYLLTRLAPTHPANLSTQIYADLIREFEDATGKKAYLAVIDPPYLPAVIGSDAEVVFDPGRFYVPHSFTKWHDIDLQQERHEYKCERSEIYESVMKEMFPEAEFSFNVKEWNRETEKNLLRALEAVAAESISDFIDEKCEGGFYMIVPNNGAQRGIKEKVKARVLERKPFLMAKPHIADVLDSLNRDAYEKNLTCSVSVYNRMAALLSNTYGYKHEKYRFPFTELPKVNLNKYADRCPDGFIYSEWAPGRGECCMHKDRPVLCLQHTFRKVLAREEYANDRELIKQYMTGNDVVIGGVTLKGKQIHIPSVYTVLKELNKDLNGELQPLRLPDMRVKRDQAKASCSEIAGTMDAAEYHLKRMGMIKAEPWLEFLAQVGNVCHETMFASAPPAWRLAMEKPGIFEGIHFKPDLVAFYSDKDDFLIVIDAKSGVAPFMTWLPKKRHSTQLGGYTWYLQNVIDKKFKESYGVIQYLQDYQTEEPRAIRIRTGEGSAAWNDFQYKRKGFMRLHDEWKGNPEQFFEDYYSKPYYHKKHLNSSRGRICIEAVEKMKKQPTLGSFA